MPNWPLSAKQAQTYHQHAFSIAQSFVYLFGNVGTEVDRQGKREVELADQVAELLGALQLVLLEPLFQELLLALLQDGTRQLHRLLPVQLARLEEHPKVLP